MKIHDSIEKAVISGVHSVSTFSIKSSAKAFNILSSTLYSNKFEAIVRELSCNAYDSHVSAGNKETPFELHLPTTLEPWFSIRDFGTGLTKDEVRSIYTTYFESTKNNSNDFIGALGLGSKSPFSYSDNFTVTAIKDGKKSIFTAFINDEGVPSVALMLEQDTTDQSGVDVKFAVHEKDFSSFSYAASNVLSFFNPLPTFTSIDVPIQTYNTESIKGVPNTRRLVNKINSVALMGNVCYPIDASLFDHSVSSILKTGLLLEFNIGDLDVQANREGLSYIPTTITAISERVKAVKKSAQDQIHADLLTLENEWDKVDYLFKHYTYPFIRTIVNDYLTINPSPLAYVNHGLYYKPLVIEDVNTKFNCKVTRIVTSNHKYSYFEVEDYKTLEFRPKFQLVFVDNQSAIPAVLYHIRQQRTYDNFYVITPFDQTAVVDEAGLLRELMNPASVLHKDNLVKRPKKTKIVKTTPSFVKANYNETQLRLENRVTFSPVVDYTALLSSTNTVYYIPMNRYEINNPASTVTNPKSLVDMLYRTYFFGMSIYGVPKKDMKLIQQKTNWVNVDRAIEQLLNSVDQNCLVSESASTLLNFKSVSHLIEDKESEFVKLITRKTSVYRHFNKQKLIELENAYSIKDKISSKISELTIQINRAQQKYELLEYLPKYTNSRVVANYINLVDKLSNIQ